MNIVEEFIATKRRYQGDIVADNTVIYRVEGGYIIKFQTKNKTMTGNRFVTRDNLSVMIEDLKTDK